jgi:hypothetical protein
MFEEKMNFKNHGCIISSKSSGCWGYAQIASFYKAKLRPSKKGRTLSIPPIQTLDLQKKGRTLSIPPPQFRRFEGLSWPGCRVWGGVEFRKSHLHQTQHILYVCIYVCMCVCAFFDRTRSSTRRHADHVTVLIPAMWAILPIGPLGSHAWALVWRNLCPKLKQKGTDTVHASRGHKQSKNTEGDFPKVGKTWRWVCVYSVKIFIITCQDRRKDINNLLSIAKTSLLCKLIMLLLINMAQCNCWSIRTFGQSEFFKNSKIRQIGLRYLHGQYGALHARWKADYVTAGGNHW